MNAPNPFSGIGQSARIRLEPMAGQIAAAWKRLSNRERNLVRLASCVGAVALIWLVGLKPALDDVQKANERLPVLQSQSSQLDAVILEAKALNRSRSGTLTTSETEEALRTSLVTVGLDGLSEISVSDETPAGWQIHFSNAPASRLIHWLASLPYVARVKTVSVDLARSNIDGRERPGQLSGTVVLAMPSTEPL